jgi:Spy/CpxP family protein refolding chaperone
MNRTLKLSLFCAGIFACGVVAGGLGARKFFSPRSWHQPTKPGQTGQNPGGSPQEGFGLQQLTRFSKELDLTEAQRAEILPLLEKAGEELRQLRREGFRQASTVIEAMESSVAERLTPAQREKLTVLQTEQRARMKARMEERNRRRAEGGERRSDESNPPTPPPPTEVSPATPEPR